MKIPCGVNDSQRLLGRGCRGSDLSAVSDFFVQGGHVE